MLISRRAVQDYLDRPFDSFTWLKELPRDRLMRELRQLPVPPVFKTDPWLHQLVCFYIGVYYPRFLFLLDMGLGKTKIILDLMTQAQREKRMRRGLVFVPRLINMESWATAAAEHSNLEPWLIDVSDVEEKYERLLNPRGDFTCIDYAGLHLACSKKRKKRKGKGFELVKDEAKVARLQKVYDFITADESHKVGNHESLWFSIVRQLTKEVRHCFGLTGTLFGRDLDAVWSQFFLIDRGETFGETLGLFRGAFFTATPDKWRGEKLVFNRDMTRQLNRMIGHRSLRYDDVEVSDLPPLVKQRRILRLPHEQREHYLRALEGLINAGGQLRELEAQWLRMRQITSGYLEWIDSGVRHHIVFNENPKMLALEGIIDDAGDNKVVVSYEYTTTGDLICEMLKARKIKYERLSGGTKDPIGAKRRFMEDPSIKVFIMNSEAGGTGVDGLQKVAHYLVCFESPSSPTPRAQVIKRIHRSGLQRRAFLIDLAMERSVDVGILDDLEADRDLFESVIKGASKLRRMWES